MRIAPRARPAAAQPLTLEPGFALKYFSYLPSTFRYSSESAGTLPLRVMFGQISLYLPFSSSQASASGSISGRIASGGNSGSHTPQAMH